MKTGISLLIVLCAVAVSAQIRVSKDHQFLSTTDGSPFFWLGDTDWELFHRLTREEAEEFLEVRRQQGFNVLQAVALAEFGGLTKPNRYGDLPLVDLDPEQLAITPGHDPTNEKEYDYWDHVDFIIQRAAAKGMYIGLLPTWGDKVTRQWGEGPVIFNVQNAEVYAATVARRYANQWNVIWILGGDRPAVYKRKEGTKEIEVDDRPIWRAMAKGIRSVVENAFIAYHPWGGLVSTSQFMPEESWLNMNAFQSGHGAREASSWYMAARDLTLKPLKPTLDMEPCYEDHPLNPWDGQWSRERGYFSAYDVRARTYRSVLAGACGVTYGHHHIWQFMDPELNPPVNTGDTIIYWKTAMHAEAAGQMQFLKRLMLSRPYYSRVQDQSLILSDAGKDYTDQLIAARDLYGSYAMIYLPRNRPVTIDLKKIDGTVKVAWWYNPRTGESIQKEITSSQFTPPKEGQDWVLIIDDASKKYKQP